MEWLRPKDYHVPCLRCFGQLRKAVLFPGGEPWGWGGGSGGVGLKLPPADLTCHIGDGRRGGRSSQGFLPGGLICIFYLVFFPEREPCSVEGSKLVEGRELIQNRAA